MRCELRYSPEQEGDAPLTLTYQIDLSAHLAPPTMRPCQVCGQPATTIIVDMLDVTPPDAVASGDWARITRLAVEASALRGA